MLTNICCDTYCYYTLIENAAVIITIGFLQHVVDFNIGQPLAQVLHDVAQIGRHDPTLSQLVKHPWEQYFWYYYYYVAVI